MIAMALRLMSSSIAFCALFMASLNTLRISSSDVASRMPLSMSSTRPGKLFIMVYSSDVITSFSDGMPTFVKIFFSISVLFSPLAISRSTSSASPALAASNTRRRSPVILSKPRPGRHSRPMYSINPLTVETSEDHLSTFCDRIAAACTLSVPCSKSDASCMPSLALVATLTFWPMSDSLTPVSAPPMP